MDTNFCFAPGTLTTVLDASAGSSGKGKIGSFIAEHADSFQFCCNTFMPQAGHWVRLSDGRTFFYQTLNSCAYLHEKYEKMYMGPGCTIELPAFWREMEENGVPHHKVGISPVAAILQDIDGAFERGEVDLDGNVVTERHLGTMKSGSTCHGVGACKARKILRRPNIKLARDIPELKEFLCNVPEEVMGRLDNGQAGLLEIAQGFQLSYLLQDFYPFCTSRNCTISAGFDDMMLPPRYAGNVILNIRTYPIRINNKKFIGEDGAHLTWDDIQAGVPHAVETYNSGPGYEDQEEIEWDELTKLSGSPEPIIEMTSVTKLPRRAFTFSKQNLDQAIRYNDTGRAIYLSVNFANYVDYDATGVSGRGTDLIGEKLQAWLKENIKPACEKYGNVELMFLGTGALTNEMIML
jgi:adenylosuccinate synthase